MHKSQPGQTLVIFAIAALALIFFIGLAVDSGSLYVTYGQLKRAVDAAAVSAANEFKRQEAGHEAEVILKMTNAATEILKLQNIPPNSVDLQVRLCDSDFDGLRDADLATVAPDFYNRCPDTPSRQARKLIWVRATQEAPLYFLHLLGFSNIPLTTDSIAEAASVDMVLVFDTSESMASAKETGTGDLLTPGYVPYKFDPAACNAADNCQPLKQAKDAAKNLIGNLYDGYDRVAIVTFDTQGYKRFNLGENNALDPKTHLQEALDAIDNRVKLHDDAPTADLIFTTQGSYNPVNPEDSNGDGSDDDDYHSNTEGAFGAQCTLNDQRWDATLNAPDGVPCDLSDFPACLSTDHYCGINDVFDMNDDDIITAADFGGLGNDIYGNPKSTSIASTCTGCGLRQASDVLVSTGRTGSVWAIIFLSDGVPNMSDTKFTDIGNPDYAAYPNGFCNGGLGSDLWKQLCVDIDFTPRYCIDTTADTCPLGSIWDNALQSQNYTSLDWAMDMTDATALTKSTNPNEPSGNEITIYTIGLGAAGGGDQVTLNPPDDVYVGEQLLRYMAAVGDDGDRTTDPCKNAAPWQTCGQYYYAATGNDLAGIFMDIASRIYTRISE